MKAVIMAGGEGARLRPVTYTIPKPLLPVGKQPIAEIIVKQLKHFGFDEIIMAVGYRGDLIKTYFQDGSKFGISIRYVEEETKLGTAGALSLIKDDLTEEFLVMNGDILVELNFSELCETHRNTDNIITVCTKEYTQSIPFGVFDVNNGTIQSVDEKPNLNFKINAGIYCLSPDALQFVPHNSFYNMTDLINDVIKDGKSVGTYQLKGNWIDLGKIEDFELAVKEIEKMSLF